LGRLRQILDTIAERRARDARYRRSLLTWQTQTLVSFIAATVPVEKGRTNPLLEVAREVTLDPEPPQPETDNRPGSFERLTSGFASGV
jgi:hypothetical protein